MSELLKPPHVFAGLRRHHYRLIHIDPPTRFEAGNKSRPQHYARMTDHDIAALPIADLMHPDGCWVAMWVTSPKLYKPMRSKKRLRPDEIAAKWGCRFSARGWLWIKLRKLARGQVAGTSVFAISDLARGQGLTTGKNAEDCLLFRRGTPRVKSRKAFEVILAPRREHSRKPEEIYAQLTTFANGPYVELFARQHRAGWDVWGDQANLFDNPLEQAACLAAKNQNLPTTASQQELHYGRFV